MMRHQALRYLLRGRHILLRPNYSARTPSLCANTSNNRMTPILNRTVQFSTSSILLRRDNEEGQFISKAEAFSYYGEHVDNEMTEVKFKDVAKQSMQVIFQAFAHGKFDDIEGLIKAEELGRWIHKYFTMDQSDKKKIMDFWDDMDKLLVRIHPVGGMSYTGSESPAVDPRNTQIVLRVICLSNNLHNLVGDIVAMQQSGPMQMLKHGFNTIFNSPRYAFDATFTFQGDPEEANWVISVAKVYTLKGLGTDRRIL